MVRWQSDASLRIQVLDRGGVRPSTLPLGHEASHEYIEHGRVYRVIWHPVSDCSRPILVIGLSFERIIQLHRNDMKTKRTACWGDGCDDSALQTQDTKFEPWRSKAEQSTSRSHRFPAIVNHYEWAGKKHFVSLKLEGQSGVRARDLRLSKQAALTTALLAPALQFHRTSSHAIYQPRWGW